MRSMVCSVFMSCALSCGVCELAWRADGDLCRGLSQSLLAEFGELGLGDWELAPEHSTARGIA
jgi:hypothetical protein